ncbi:MAG: TonB-dependent receptor, partial [Kordiimonadaceae bacterium]|nr:TonB-dependent receptor [Kordiimonadaceae bacterium]
RSYNVDQLIAPGVRDNTPLNNPLPLGTADPAFAQNTIVFLNGDIPSTTNSFDLTDPNIARAHVTISSANELEDEVFETRFDANWDFEADGILKSLSVGGFYSDRSKKDLPYNNGVGPNGQDGIQGGNVPGHIIPGAPLDGFGRTATGGRFLQAPPEFFTPISVPDLLDGQGANGAFPTSYLELDLEGYCGWLRENTGNQNLCTFNARPEFRNAVSEEIKGAYAQLDIGGDFGDVPWAANFGLRYEDTSTVASGPFSALIDVAALNPDGSSSGLIVTTTPLQTLEEENGYSNWLPSFNFSAGLSDSVLLRFAAAKVITRPTLAQIVPGQTFPQRNFEAFTRVATNPFLDPFEAWQLDAALEYYADNGNAFSVNLFYKNITSFISETTELTDSGYDHETFGDIITRSLAPRNRSGGTIQGFEVAALVYFDFLPGLLANTGLQANYTFVSSEDDSANDEVGQLPLVKQATTGLEGFTPHAYNIVGFYEDDTIRARVAYNWRDTFLDLRSGPEGIPAHFDAYGQLDAGFAYRINDQFELTFEASNLLNENTIRFADIRERVLLNEYTGRRFFFGVRYVH